MLFKANRLDTDDWKDMTNTVVKNYSITIYTKPASVQGNDTFRAFSKIPVSYSVIDLSADAEALDYVMALGYLQAPVVVIHHEDGSREDEHWSGFRPERIDAIGSVHGPQCE